MGLTHSGIKVLGAPVGTSEFINTVGLSIVSTEGSYFITFLSYLPYILLDYYYTLVLCPVSITFYALSGRIWLLVLLMESCEHF